MAISINTINVLNFLKAHSGDNLTAQDVADALGIDVKVVNGAFTSGIWKKGYGNRVEAEVEYTGDDGNVLHKKVKFLTLTPEGMAFEPETSEE